MVIFAPINMRGLISIILMMVFMTTVLPVRQIGNMLAKNQLNEEVNEQGPQTLEEKTKQCPNHSYCGHYSHIDLRHPSLSFLYNLDGNFKERIPVFPASDVVIPPPKSA